jgi:hypothetical protein
MATTAVTAVTAVTAGLPTASLLSPVNDTETTDR